MILEQLERISDIASTIDGLNTAWQAPTQESTRLPLLLPIPSSPDYTTLSATSYTVSLRWDLYLYLAEYGQGNNITNLVNLLTYVEAVAELFLSRHLLQLGNSPLQHVRNTSFTTVTGLTDPITYPPRGGSVRYWGAKYQLTVTSTKHQNPKPITGA